MESKKPVRKIIPAADVMKYIGQITGEGLIKDLHETEKYTEEICEICGGTGLRLTDNCYGLSDEHIPGNMFPYKHQGFRPCECCFNGIVKRCRYCGELLPVYSLKCNCPAQKEEEEAERIRKAKEELEKAPLMSDEEAAEEEVFYSDAYPCNDGYFSGWDDFFDAWDSEHEPGDERPEYVWVTDKIELALDAADIVSGACDDLDEDAYERVSSAVPKLQESIDDWLDNYGTWALVESHRAKVRIPWERYEGENEGGNV